MVGEVSAQNKTAFNNLDSLFTVEDRPVVVFFQAEWCKFCHQMKQTTLSDNGISNLLDSNFYFIPFDVETREDVQYSGQVFSYNPTGTNTGIHEIALELTTIEYQIELPALCVFHSQNEVLFQHNGLMSVEELEVVLDALRN